jgi:Flp pilus assembly protein TadD
VLRVESAVASIEQHFEQGRQLLDSGLLAEAIREFDQCLLSSPTYAVAWESKALAYERLGQQDSAAAARLTAQHIRETLWQRSVEAEIDGRNELSGREAKSS